MKSVNCNSNFSEMMKATSSLSKKVSIQNGKKTRKMRLKLVIFKHCATKLLSLIVFESWLILLISYLVLMCAHWHE